MHTYTLTITKDDFLLEFKSTDKNIVEQELGVWILACEEYLDDLPPYTEPAEAPQPEKIELGQIIVERPSQARQKTVEAISEPEPITTKTESGPTQSKEVVPVPTEAASASQSINFERLGQIQKEILEKREAQTYKISDETKQILHKAIHKPKQSMKEILAEKQIKEYKTVDTPKTPKQLQSEPVKISNLPPVLPPPATVLTQQQPAAIQEDPLQQDGFTEVFNQKVVQEQNNSDKFMELLSLQTIHTKFDCLIACAYHLIERENFERFTLKQINALSKALLEEAIEHDTLKEALERRLIKIVPDYTGIATTMEYTLTDQGARYFEREISTQF